VRTLGSTRMVLLSWVYGPAPFTDGSQEGTCPWCLVNGA